MTGNKKTPRLLLVSLLTLLAVGLTGCSTEQLVQDSIREQYPDELAFLPTGSELSFVISFNARWSMTAPEWIQCSQKSGSEGTVSFKVATGVNRTGIDLAGTVDFACDDGTRISLNAFQPAPYLRVSFPGESEIPSYDPSGDVTLQFNWNDSKDHGGRAVPVIVESNVDWRFDFSDLTTPESEFILSQDSGYGYANLTLVPRRNNLDKQAYACILTAEAYMPDGETLIGEGVDSPSFALNQKNLRFLLNDSTDDIEVVIDELQQPIAHGTILVDSELSWALSGTAAWVEMSATSGDAGVTEIHFSASSVNPSREERDKDIVLRSSGGAERVIHVRQNPFVFSIQSNQASFDNEGTAAQTFNVLSSGPWSVDGPDWLNISASGQEGNGSLTLSCKEQNLALEDLSGFVRLTSQLNLLTETVSVTQDAFLFDATPDETLGKIPALSTLTYPIGIRSSGAWSLSSDQSWVFLSQHEGSKDATIYAGSDSYNPDLATDRSATVTLVSETHKAKGITLTKEIPLTQTKFKFTIAPSSTSLPAYLASPTFFLAIECSEKWEIVACPDWLVPETRNGTYDKKLAVSVAPNTDKTHTRSGRIRVHSLYDDSYLETDLIVQDHFVFQLDQTSFRNLPPVEAGQKSITVSCTDNAPWAIESKPAWLNVNSASGTGTSTLVVTPQDNGKTTSRLGDLVIKSNVSGETLTVSFSQEAYVFSVTGTSFSFGELDASSKTIAIDCSSNWTIDPGNASWLKFSSKSGKGNANVTLTADNNVYLVAREATITVYSNLQHGTADELKKTVTVSQSAYRFNTETVSLSNLSAVNDKGLSQTVPISCSGDWEVKGAPEWLTVKPSSGRGNGSIQVTPATNSDLNERNASFEIVSKDNPSLKKTVNVKQNAYVFSIDNQKMDFAAAASSKSVTLRSSAKWTVASNQSWLTVSAKEGDGDKTLTVSVEKNSTKADRTGKVTFTSQYGNHVLTIDVTQKKD